MAITKLKGLLGEAEVLGSLREVAWTDTEGGLLIKGLTLEEAERALNLLSTGTVTGIRFPEAQPSKVREAVEKVASAAAVAHAAIARATPPPDKLAEIGKVIKATKEVDAGLVEKVVEQAVVTSEAAVAGAKLEEVAKGTPPATKQNGEDKAVAAIPPATNGSFDVAMLAKMTSLGEVVVYLYEHGLTTPEVLVAECAKLKEQVPLLGRVTNLDERVRRAFEVKGLAVAAQA